MMDGFERNDVRTVSSKRPVVERYSTARSHQAQTDHIHDSNDNNDLNEHNEHHNSGNSTEEEYVSGRSSFTSTHTIIPPPTKPSPPTPALLSATSPRPSLALSPTASPEFSIESEATAVQFTAARASRTSISRPTSRHTRSFSRSRPNSERDSLGLGLAGVAYGNEIPEPLPALTRRISDNIGTRAMRRTQSQSISGDYFGGNGNDASPTPANEEALYLRYALEQITRDERDSRGTSGETQYGANPEPGYPEKVYQEQDQYDLRPPGKGRYNPKDSLASLALPGDGEELYLACEPDASDGRHPALTFLPKTLRPGPLAMLILATLLLAAATLFCAIWSQRHGGLWQHTGPYDGRYVLFNYLPSILFAGLYLWIEGLVAALTRILPYRAMTSTSSRARQNALFLRLYPRALLYPQFRLFSHGQPVLGAAMLALWPMVVAVPLSAAMFSVSPGQDGNWDYVTSQPVAYTLFAILVLALLGHCTIFAALLRRATGLLWDPRDLASLIALLSRSNTLDDYDALEALPAATSLRARLFRRADRLGYWQTTSPTQSRFYGIGEEGAPARRYSVNHARTRRSMRQHPHGAEGRKEKLRSRIYDPRKMRAYTPWYLTRSAALLWPLALGTLFAALLIVSFHPRLSLARGFAPTLPVAPDTRGFSPAAFFYSFVPALIGMALHGSLSTLLHALARVTPWKHMAHPSGATPRRSILVDYAARTSVPFATALPALRNRDFLIAYLGVLVPVTLVLPVLGGGMFAAYTALPSGAVLVFADLRAFYALIAILALYLVALVWVAVEMFRRHGAYALPRPVTTLAESISLLYASGVRRDAAFSAVRSRTDLRTRLVGARERGGEEVRYFVGVFKGGDEMGHWGVERVGRVSRRRSREERMAGSALEGSGLRGDLPSVRGAALDGGEMV